MKQTQTQEIQAKEMVTIPMTQLATIRVITAHKSTTMPLKIRLKKVKCEPVMVAVEIPLKSR